MGLIVLPKTLVAHTNAKASDVMADLNAIVAQVNGSLNAENLAASIRQALYEPGDMKPTGRAAAPTGWLICNGAAVSRATYAALFGAIGTAFGAGDGVTTFNVPDLRGRMPIGVDTGHVHIDGAVAPAALGNGGGNMWLQAHHHHLNLNSGTESVFHHHGVPGFANTRHEGSGFGYTNFDGGFEGAQTANQSALHIHNTQGDTEDTGAGGSQNMPPYQVVQWLIKI